VAVTVAVELLVRLAVLALTVAEVAPAATVTEVGTDNELLLSVILTAAPPLGAAWVRVTVQVLDAFGPRLVGLQTSDETRTDTARLTVAFAAVPSYVAVRVALPELEIVAAVAWKLVLVAPAATVTDAGTGKEVLLSERVTIAPPVGAARDSDTVQVVAAPEVKLVGVH
jgi:hypothetical protein